MNSMTRCAIVVAILLAGQVNAASAPNGGPAGSENRPDRRSVVSVDGTGITYEVRGEGRTIVLLHGFTADGSFWEDYGYVDLLEGFRLILVDARGHGTSGLPTTAEALRLKSHVDDLAAVVTAECDSPPVFWGYSMGAGVGYHAMLHRPGLFSAYILGDGAPFGVFGLPDEIRERHRAMAAMFREGKGYASGFPKDQRNAFADFLELDRQEELRDIRDRFPQVTAPTLIYRSGETAPAVPSLEAQTGFSLEAHFTQLERMEFPAFNHLEAWRRSDMVVPRVMEFLAE